MIAAAPLAGHVRLRRLGFTGLALSLLTATSATVGSAQSLCFDQAPTVVDNGPGDLDPRPYFITTSGRSVILGSDGDDVITASSVGDVICGLGGNDRIRALVGGRTDIDAGDGNDSVSVTTAPDAQPVDFDLVYLGSGNDTLEGDERYEMSVQAGDGQNTIHLQGVGFYVIHGGPDRDVVDLQAIFGAVMSDAGNDSIRVVGQQPGISPGVSIDAGPGDDTVDLPDGGNWSVGPIPPGVEGGEGNDTITIGLGGVAANGGPGNDRIVWRNGRTPGWVSGDDGNDQITVDSGVPVYILGGEGNDTIRDSAPGGCGEQSPDRILCIVGGGPGQDQITLTGSGSHLVTGDDGNDILAGGTQDTLDGGPGHDICGGADGTAFDGCEVSLAR